MKTPVGIGIIGLGFIGQTHARAFRSAQADGFPCRLRAVCDRSAERRAGQAAVGGNLSTANDPAFDPSNLTAYADAADLLTDASVHLVCICTHTDTHVDLAIAALSAGKHVLVEKPVATSLDEVMRLKKRADRSDRLCIPAMCVRYWPGWSDLVAAVDSGIYGRPIHARFERLGSPPLWASDFYADPARCGNAIYDLHVHDADFVLRLFGRPQGVFSRGDDRHIVSQPDYPGGPHVVIEGGWLTDTSCPFRMAYTVEFERGVMTYDSQRDPAMSVYTGGAATAPNLPARTGFDEQARAVTTALATGRGLDALPTIDDAVAVTRLIEAERKSAGIRRSIDIDWEG